MIWQYRDDTGHWLDIDGIVELEKEDKTRWLTVYLVNGHIVTLPKQDAEERIREEE